MRDEEVRNEQFKCKESKQQICPQQVESSVVGAPSTDPFQDLSDPGPASFLWAAGGQLHSITVALGYQHRLITRCCIINHR